jgi:hypothetical protein
MGAVGWLLKGCKPGERADGGQAQVARPDAGAPARRHPDRRAPRPTAACGAAPGQREQQPERIPVGCDRVWADIALTHEPLGKIALDERESPRSRPRSQPRNRY